MSQPLTKRLVTEASLTNGPASAILATKVAAALDSAIDAEIPQIVEQAIEDYAPGARIGTQRVNDTFTNTAAAYPGSSLPGLSMPIIGNGRDVDIEVTFPSIKHTAANANITICMLVDGAPLDAQGTLQGVQLGPADGADSFILRKTMTIPDGVTRTVSFTSYANVAGTTTFTAASFVPVEFTATRA